MLSHWHRRCEIADIAGAAGTRARAPLSTRSPYELPLSCALTRGTEPSAIANACAQRRYAAFWQRSKAGMKLFIERTPRCFVAPFEMSSVRTSIVARRVIPRDAERPVRADQSAQKCELENITDIAGILVTHRLAPKPFPLSRCKPAT
jgi:hypothetical protein